MLVLKNSVSKIIIVASPGSILQIVFYYYSAKSLQDSQHCWAILAPCSGFTKISYYTNIRQFRQLDKTCLTTQRVIVFATKSNYYIKNILIQLKKVLPNRYLCKFIIKEYLPMLCTIVLDK